MNENEGVLIVLSGPSGTGKGAIYKKILEINKEINYSISATTRQPRKDEAHGKDYYFYKKEEFEALIKNDEILEYTIYCDNYYGTPLKFVKDCINTGKNVILEIEVNGASQIKNKIPECISVFILPPSIKELKERLKFRNTENEESLKKRLNIAKQEIEKAGEYDYIVINDNLDKCVNDIINIINIQKFRPKYSKNKIKEVINNE